MSPTVKISGGELAAGADRCKRCCSHDDDVCDEKPQKKPPASLNYVKAEFCQVKFLSEVSHQWLYGGNITTYFLLNQCQLFLSNHKHLIMEPLINVQHQSILGGNYIVAQENSASTEGKACCYMAGHSYLPLDRVSERTSLSLTTVIPLTPMLIA